MLFLLYSKTIHKSSVSSIAYHFVNFPNWTNFIEYLFFRVERHAFSDTSNSPLGSNATQT